MSKAPDRSTIAGAAYLDLRRLAAETSRPTDELHQLYALEGFLDRLIRSNHRNTFALKGGVLLAAYTERRPTRDVVLAASQLQADAASILAIVTEILDIAVDDGLTFDLLNTEVETIRDNADYPGMRTKVTGSLATAIIRFHIDINIGDPIWPDPLPVELPRLHEMARLRRHRCTRPHQHRHPNPHRVNPPSRKAPLHYNQRPKRHPRWLRRHRPTEMGRLASQTTTPIGA